MSGSNSNNNDMEERARQLLDRNPYSVSTGVKLSYIRDNSPCLTMEAADPVKNLYGTVHGGAYFTLADSCAGMTARLDGNYYVTQHASVSFLSPAMSGTLTARGKVIKRGGKTCLVEVIITDEADRPVFHGTFSFFRIEGNPLPPVPKQQ